MTELATVDSRDLVLVDNATDTLPTVPSLRERAPRLLRRGLKRLSGQPRCAARTRSRSPRAEARRAHAPGRHGPDAWVFERNVDRLGFDMATVDGMALSHGHWDHGGAMVRALEMIQLASGGRPVPTYMHPGMYRTRAMKMQDGSMRPFEDVPTAAMLEQQGALVVHATEPCPFDGLFHVSGEIARHQPSPGCRGSSAAPRTAPAGSPTRCWWTSVTWRCA
jgi:7,8-dihydropterin-6-yl-methyl-4-(beta-D-ribofuranosyl)aminobenzene 5'-phosphate synthase